MEKKIYEKYGKLEDLDRSFDLDFWKKQSPTAKADAVKQMVVYVYKTRGIDVSKQRLDRSVESFQKKRW